MIKNNKLYCDVCEKEMCNNNYEKLKNAQGIKCINCIDKCIWWNKCFYNKKNKIIKDIEYLGHS